MSILKLVGAHKKNGLGQQLSWVCQGKLLIQSCIKGLIGIKQYTCLTVCSAYTELIPH